MIFSPRIAAKSTEKQPPGTIWSHVCPSSHHMCDCVIGVTMVAQHCGNTEGLTNKSKERKSFYKLRTKRLWFIQKKNLKNGRAVSKNLAQINQGITRSFLHSQKQRGKAGLAIYSKKDFSLYSSIIHQQSSSSALTTRGRQVSVVSFPFSIPTLTKHTHTPHFLIWARCSPALMSQKYRQNSIVSWL